MSEFVSWDEREVRGEKQILFLTDKELHTPKGNKLIKESHGDFIGHSAIRFYYDLPESRGRLHERECTNFSTPKKFPDAIVKAIKDGNMTEFEFPEGLLLKKGLKLTEQDPEVIKACNAYIKAFNAWYKACNDWYKARDAYNKARDAYNKARDAAKWKVFANPENRPKAWR